MCSTVGFVDKRRRANATAVLKYAVQNSAVHLKIRMQNTSRSLSCHKYHKITRTTIIKRWTSKVTISVQWIHFFRIRIQKAKNTGSTGSQSKTLPLCKGTILIFFHPLSKYKLKFLKACCIVLKNSTIYKLFHNILSDYNLTFSL